MTKVQSMTNAALAATTATERLTNFLRLDPSGLPGATELRARQERAKSRIAAALPWSKQGDEYGPWLKVYSGVTVAISWSSPSPRLTASDYRSQLRWRRMMGKGRQAEKLATDAGQMWDEHGSSRGDYLTTTGLDWVNPAEAKATPYCDMGGRGLALIEITRKRVYAKSSKWYPRETSTRYLVGRNEAGTYFAHAVPAKIGSVRGAVDWIWNGKAEAIIARQGDIALITSRGPARIPPLPSGHRVNGSMIYHETHPAIRKPDYGEAVIVARRAVVRASNETRD